MAIFHAPETETAKELKKWEYGPKEQGFRGHRTFEEFPKMMSLAGRGPQGGITIVDEQVAADRVAEGNLASRGFRMGRDAAIEAYKEARAVEGEAAAERAFTDRRMSPAAQAEAAAADEAAGMRHVGAVPETPIKRRRGRPPKPYTPKAEA